MVFHRGICLYCHEHNLTTKTLDDLEAAFKPACEYNKLLYSLYLTYIRKCKLRAHLGHQAARLKEILEREKVSAIKSWADIEQLSKNYQLWDNHKTQSGCAFRKIARMLNGLGVLDVSWKDSKACRRRHEKIMKTLSIETAAAAEGFIATLAKQNRSPRTAFVYLEIILKFEDWLRNISPDHSILLARTHDIEIYLDNLQSKKYANGEIYNHFRSLHKFFRWCVIEKKMLINPALSIEVTRPERSIRVCAESDLNSLLAFVKNSETDPTDGILISLILYFGFTIEQLCLAQLAPLNGGALRLILASNKKTFSSRLKRSGHHLDLPSNSAWFLGLQKRYALQWQERFTQIKHISVRRPLFLQENQWHNTPIDPSILRLRLHRATKRALGGKAVCWQVLHNSCGVLYTRHDDASLLTKLGWSKSQASSYVYVTKKIYSPSTEK